MTYRSRSDPVRERRIERPREDADLYPPPADEVAGSMPTSHAVLAVVVLSAIAVFAGGIAGSVIRGEELEPPFAPDLFAEPGGPAGDPAAGAGDPEAVGGREFEDGLVLTIQPCATEPTGPDCGASGAVNTGTVWVLISFEEGTPDDVIGLNVMTRGDEPVGGGQVALADLGCEGRCGGWTYLKIENLEPGPYRVNANRNGRPAGSVGFRVEPPG